jgi:hypothetical protein
VLRIALLHTHARRGVHHHRVLLNCAGLHDFDLAFTFGDFEFGDIRFRDQVNQRLELA